MDSRGLSASDTPIGFGRERSPADEIQRVRRRVEGLRTLAVDTDGIAVIDTNDIDTGLKRIVADMSSYYLVGYYTKNAKLDGRFRKITVRVKRPGVNVRARRGYKAATAAELAPPKETAAKVERAVAADPGGAGGHHVQPAVGRPDVGGFRAPRQRSGRSRADVDGRGTRRRRRSRATSPQAATSR